jgi:predicted transcriptional regulator
MTIANRVHKKTQAPSFKTTVKKRLVDLELKVTHLAKTLGLSRGAVSLAINHESMLPKVKDRIRKELSL